MHRVCCCKSHEFTLLVTFLFLGLLSRNNLKDEKVSFSKTKQYSVFKENWRLNLENGLCVPLKTAKTIYQSSKTTYISFTFESTSYISTKLSPVQLLSARAIFDEAYQRFNQEVHTWFPEVDWFQCSYKSTCYLLWVISWAVSIFSDCMLSLQLLQRNVT